MIDEVFFLLKAAFKAKGVPYELVYGPTQVPPQIGASRIQILRDVDGGDIVQAGRARFPNPKMFAVRASGAMVRIHASSTIGGAQRYDHERLADAIVDQVQVELFKIVRNAKTEWRVLKAGFVIDPNLPDGWAGVVYELRFQIDRGVTDVSWVGDKAAEGTFTGGAATSLDTSGSPSPASKQLPNATTRIEP